MYPLARETGLPQNWTGHSGKEKSLLMLGMELSFCGCPAHCLVPF
jgi:hypothetical protein